MENLFGDTKELSRKDKLKKSKALTASLTIFAIDYLNDNGFVCHRSNNYPSQRIVKKEMIFNAFDKDGNPIQHKYLDVQISFKKGNIKQTILDISGVRWDGLHTELEVKTGKDQLSEAQLDRIKTLKSFGAISFAFSDKETFLIQINPYLKPKELAF